MFFCFFVFVFAQALPELIKSSLSPLSLSSGCTKLQLRAAGLHGNCSDVGSMLPSGLQGLKQLSLGLKHHLFCFPMYTQPAPVCSMFSAPLLPAEAIPGTGST